MGVVDGGGPSGSVVGVGLSARRLEAVFTPPNNKKNVNEVEPALSSVGIGH